MIDLEHLFFKCITGSLKRINNRLNNPSEYDKEAIRSDFRSIKNNLKRIERSLYVESNKSL